MGHDEVSPNSSPISRTVPPSSAVKPSSLGCRANSVKLHKTEFISKRLAAWRTLLDAIFVRNDQSGSSLVLGVLRGLAVFWNFGGFSLHNGGAGGGGYLRSIPNGWTTCACKVDLVVRYLMVGSPSDVRGP